MRRVYQFQKADYQLQNLEHKRIKTSALDGVNDPYELMACTVKRYEHNHHKLRKVVTDNFTVHCFARSSEDEHLWDRYGDQGRGICLGIDIDDITLEVTEVRYVAELDFIEFPPHLEEAFREALAHQKILTTEEQLEGAKCLKPVLWTKFDEWSAEREVRAVDSKTNKEPDEHGLYFDSFSDTMVLQAVILGPKCEVSEAKIRALVASYQNAPEVTSEKNRRAERIKGWRE